MNHVERTLNNVVRALSQQGYSAAEIRNAVDSIHERIISEVVAEHWRKVYSNEEETS